MRTLRGKPIITMICELVAKIAKLEDRQAGDADTLVNVSTGALIDYGVQIADAP
jgi:hypothetical protein